MSHQLEIKGLGNKIMEKHLAVEGQGEEGLQEEGDHQHEGEGHLLEEEELLGEEQEGHLQGEEVLVVPFLHGSRVVSLELNLCLLLLW